MTIAGKLDKNIFHFGEETLTVKDFSEYIISTNTSFCNTPTPILL